MSLREVEVATWLRGYAALVSLVPGGIYADSTLGTEGMSDPTTTPGAYSGGLLRPCILVHAGASVPGLRFADLKRQHADANQRIECQVYARDATLIEPILNRIYTRMQGHQFDDAWPAMWVGGMGTTPYPDNSLGPGVHMGRYDFQIVTIRRPIPA